MQHPKAGRNTQQLRMTQFGPLIFWAAKNVRDFAQVKINWHTLDTKKYSKKSKNRNRLLVRYVKFEIFDKKNFLETG